MSFVNQIVKQDGGGIHLISATEKGRMAWFLLEVDPSSYSEYKAKMREGSLNIRDYGTILQFGWGEPPAELVAEYAS